jgi:hypothetical protein
MWRLRKERKKCYTFNIFQTKNVIFRCFKWMNQSDNIRMIQTVKNVTFCFINILIFKRYWYLLQRKIWFVFLFNTLLTIP